MVTCSQPIDTVDDVMNNKEKDNIRSDEKECNHREIQLRVLALIVRIVLSRAFRHSKVLICGASPCFIFAL